MILVMIAWTMCYYKIVISVVYYVIHNFYELAIPSQYWSSVLVYRIFKNVELDAKQILGFLVFLLHFFLVSPNAWFWYVVVSANNNVDMRTLCLIL